jgi:anaerobic magnesium-protoporphyrin IX monomethyl ester cyclase
LCDEIKRRGLNLTFEAETRLDRLDVDLLDRLYAAGFRAMSFGVESLDPATLKKSGRRPIPQSHQREIIGHCRKLGIVTAAFYVLGFLQDDWNSVAATIDYATDLGSTFAQFKMLTPYPGTPMFKQIEPLLTETDWEKFDGFTPTFKHPNLTERELRFLLGAAYKRFYMRPSYLANFLKIQNGAVREWVSRMDRRVNERHSREEIADISRPVAC